MNFGLDCICITLALAGVAGSTACTTSTPGSPTDGGTVDGSTSSGVTSGPADTHCAAADGGAARVQPTSASSCHPEAGAPDAAASGDAGPAKADYGDTLYNQEGDDDDCKYRVKWSASGVAQKADITFTITVTKKADGAPLTGASPYVEPFLSDTHPGNSSRSKTVETSPGVYTIGPVQLDSAGKWTVRFHFFGDCVDFVDDSPHGHAAFFVSVL